jgi:hypothetical protein
MLVQRQKIPRWATVRRFDKGDDLAGPREEVIEIHSREGGTRPDVATRISDPKIRAKYRVVQVPNGVLPGMVKGGTVDAVGGYGFREMGMEPSRKRAVG